MGFSKFFGNENKSKDAKKKNEGIKDGMLNILDIIALVKKTKKPAIIFGSHYIAKPIFDKFGFYN